MIFLLDTALTQRKSICFPQVHAPKELSAFTATTMVLFFLVATCGNLSVVITIIRDPLSKLHSPFNYFLLNLALSDLLFGIVCAPIGAAVHVQEYMKILQMTTVRVLHMAVFISGTASLLSLIALMIDRFVAVTYASKYKSVFKFWRCVIICVSIWVFSISFPFFYFAWNFTGYFMFFTHSAVFSALLIIVIVQIRIKQFFKDHSKKKLRNVAASAPPKSQRALEAKELLFQKKMSRLYLVILTVFVSIYAPAVIMIYILEFCHSCNCIFLHVLRDLSFLLVCANSCVNPFIYAIRVKSFRASLKATFSKRYRDSISKTSYGVYGISNNGGSVEVEGNH